MATRATFNATKATAILFKTLGRNLDAAALVIQERARINISILGPPRSSPGGAPHVDTGVLRDSVDHVVDVNTLTASVGTNVEYGGVLEVGSDDGTIAARPWLWPSALEVKDDVVRALAKP